MVRYRGLRGECHAGCGQLRLICRAVGVYIVRMNVQSAGAHQVSKLRGDELRAAIHWGPYRRGIHSPFEEARILHQKVIYRVISATDRDRVQRDDEQSA